MSPRILYIIKQMSHRDDWSQRTLSQFHETSVLLKRHSSPSISLIKIIISMQICVRKGCAANNPCEWEIALRLEPPFSAAHVEIGMIIRLLSLNTSLNGKVNGLFSGCRNMEIDKICRFEFFVTVRYITVSIS